MGYGYYAIPARSDTTGYRRVQVLREQSRSASTRLPLPAVATPSDAEDLAMLNDPETMAHIRAAEEAHAREAAGEEVDWESVIREHIVR